MRSSEWVLIHYDWGLRERGSWGRHTHREDTMKEEGAAPAGQSTKYVQQATRSQQRPRTDPFNSPQRKQPGGTLLALDLQPHNCDNRFLLFKPLGLWHFVIGSQGN